MKRIKAYKGFIIKERTKKEEKEGYLNYLYYVYSKDNEIIWECDTIEEAEIFIENY